MGTKLNILYLTLLERDIEKIKAEIMAFTDEKNLWITAGTIKNSAGNLCLHLTGALNHFVGAVLGNTHYVRNYEEEFLLKNISRIQLIVDLLSAKTVIRDVLSNLRDVDLYKIYPEKLQGEEMPVYWLLAHVVAHVNYHLGQMNYVRRIIDHS